MEEKKTEAPVISTPTVTTIPEPSTRWRTHIGAFATTIGKPFEEVTQTLIDTAVNQPDDDGLVTLASPTAVSDALWEAMFPKPGVKVPLLNRAVSELRVALAPEPVRPAIPVPSAGAPAALSWTAILPVLPIDVSAFDKLIIGGALEEGLQPVDAVTAIEAAMAEDIGLPKVPETLVKLIETYTTNRKKRVVDPGSLFKLIREIKKRRYAEVLSALELNSDIVTNDEREQFLSRMRQRFWPALGRHWEVLHTWIENQRLVGADPTAMFQMFTAAMSGNPAMAQAAIPVADVQVLRDATSGLADATNELYSGLYAYPTVRALAAEALRIISYLDSSSTHFAKILTNTGLADREALLTSTGASVTDTWVRNKRAVQQYAFAALEIRNKSDVELPSYAVALHNVGVSVPWSDLGRQTMSSASPRPPSIKGGRKDDPRYRPFDEVIDHERVRRG